MKLILAHILLLFFIVVAWICHPVSSTSSLKSSQDYSDSQGDDESKGAVSPRRIGLNFGTIRPLMRVLGMMGLPLLPLILIRQLVAGGAGGAAQALAGGGGSGGLGGLFSPFNAGGGGGLGGLRPLGQGLRPFGGGGLRPLGGGGGLRPFGGLLGGAGNAGQAAAAGGAAAGTAGGTLFLKKRSVEPQSSSKFDNFLTALVKLEKVFDRYDVSVPDCQRLIVCEVHRRGLSPSIGSFAEKLIQAFGIEYRLERSSFRSNTKSVLKDFLKAARNGLTQKNCSTIYNRCPMMEQRSSMRKGKI